MESPLTSGPWISFDQIGSTQDYAIHSLLEDYENAPGVVFTTYQTQGRGRFDRKWTTVPGASLCVTMIFKSYADHPKPWLIGMSINAYIAKILNCQVRWPNDLALHGKKLGGVLTQMISCKNGKKIPVVGLGINISIDHFPPEISSKAISLSACSDGTPQPPEELVHKIIDRLEEAPEPYNWSSIEPLWKAHDDTPGKQYVANDGRLLTALEVGNGGQLLASYEGRVETVMVADALFGN